MFLMPGRWSALAGVVLATASAVALAILPANDIMSIHRTALNLFLQPGVIVWWVLLAGPYQFCPTGVAGSAAIVLANTGCWLLALWLAAAVVRGPVTRRWYFAGGPGLAVISLAILVMRESSRMVPSAVQDPLVTFVQPGVTAWWFGFGTIFQGSPSSRGGMVFAALANTGLWLAAFRLLEGGLGWVRQKIHKRWP